MDIPLFKTNLKLTGRIRHRANWRGKMIAQVEYSYQLTRGYEIHPLVRLKWQDATFFDIQILGPLEVPQK